MLVDMMAAANEEQSGEWVGASETLEAWKFGHRCKPARPRIEPGVPSPLAATQGCGEGDTYWAGGYLARAEGWRLLSCTTCSAKPLSVCSMPVRRCPARSWTPTMR